MSNVSHELLYDERLDHVVLNGCSEHSEVETGVFGVQRPGEDGRVVATVMQQEGQFIGIFIMRLRLALLGVQEGRDDGDFFQVIAHQKEDLHDTAYLVPEEAVAQNGDFVEEEAGIRGTLVIRQLNDLQRLDASDIVDALGEVYLAEVAEVVGAGEKREGESHPVDIQQILHEVVLVDSLGAVVSGIEAGEDPLCLQHPDIIRQVTVDAHHVLQSLGVVVSEVESDHLASRTDSFVSPARTTELSALYAVYQHCPFHGPDQVVFYGVLAVLLSSQTCVASAVVGQSQGHLGSST